MQAARGALDGTAAVGALADIPVLGQGIGWEGNTIAVVVQQPHVVHEHEGGRAAAAEVVGMTDANGPKGLDAEPRGRDASDVHRPVEPDLHFHVLAPPRSSRHAAART